MLTSTTHPTAASPGLERARTFTAPSVIVWLLLMLAIVLLSLSQYDSFQVGGWIDDAAYVTLARSAFQPGAYAWLISHSEFGPLTYPSGYPLFLAPLAALFPASFAALKASSLILTLASASLLYWGWEWFAPGFSFRWAIAVAGLYSVSRLTIEYTRMIMSEPLFILLSFVVLLLTERAADGKGSIAQSVVLGALGAYAVAVRSVGLILLGTVLAYLILRLRLSAWRVLVPAMATGIFVVVLVGQVTGAGLASFLPARYLRSGTSLSAAASAPPQAGTLSAQDTEPAEPTLTSRLAVSVYGGAVQRFGLDLDPLVFPLGGGPTEERIVRALQMPWLPPLIGFAISGIVLLGFAACVVRRRVSVFMAYGILYLLTTLVWVSEGGRLLYPILAQLVLAFLVGVDVLFIALLQLAARARLIAEPTRRYALGGVVAVIAALSLFQILQIQDSRIHFGDLQARTRWLRENSQPSDVYMTEYATVDAAYSGHQVVRYPPACTDAAATWDYLRKHEVSYVLVASHKRWQETYVPEYTERAACMLDALAGLAADGRVREIYSSAPGMIRVYQVQTGETSG